MTERKFKVGDRVKVVNDALFEADSIGKTGTISRATENGRCWVKFDDPSTCDDFGYASDLALLEPAAPQPLSELTINGHRYVLADEQPAAEPEQKREPQLGEIWRDAVGDIVRISRVGGQKAQAVVLNKPRQYWGEPSRLEDATMVLESRHRGGWTFLYPSLAAAIKAGEKFK